MGELRESSMLISLQALMQAERERVIKEQEERLQAEIEAERREQEALLERQRSEERRALEARRRVEEEGRRRREEDARLVAIQRAEVERVKLETEHRSALELLSRKEQHEREVAALRAAENRQSSRYFLWAALLLALCVAVPVVVYFFAIAPADTELRQSYRAQLESERARADEASRLAREAELKRTEAERALDANERRVRDAAQPTPVNSTRPPKGPRRTPSTPTPTRRTDCNPEDPMDFCL